MWDTIPQPDWDTFKYGGPNGFLDLFNNGGGSFAQQYKYTDAPDADARMVQAAYWADTYAKAQGRQSQIAATLADAAKLGDFLRYSMFDKYFKQISANCSQQGSVACPAGTARPTRTPTCCPGTTPGAAPPRRRLVVADQRHHDPRGLPEPAGGLRAVHRLRPDPAVPHRQG